MKNCKFCSTCEGRRNLANVVIDGIPLFPIKDKKAIKTFKKDYCSDPVNSKRCPVYGYVPTEQ